METLVKIREDYKGRDQVSGIRGQGSGIRDQGSGIRDQGTTICGSVLRDVKLKKNPGCHTLAAFLSLPPGWECTPINPPPAHPCHRFNNLTPDP
jgi:hypothetical protein